jgi:hypothetical protein
MQTRVFAKIIVASACAGLLAVAPAAADPITITTSLTSAQANGSTIALDLNNDVTYTPLYASGYDSTITTANYTVTFTGLTAGEGVRQGSSGVGAVPVAGVLATMPTYLQGDFGSPQTTNIADSGAYFSTGKTGTNDGITVTFDSTIHYITLLWGSVDTTNMVTLLNNGNSVGTVTGTQIQAATLGFVSNGYQGAGGSAYVELYDPNGFNGIYFSSGVNSFEFTGIAGSEDYMQIPEPASAAILAAGLAMLAFSRPRRWRTAAS